ncbi:MAG: T9SS type A sorting domain-containing protein [Bacteroidales bacterium]
MNRFCKIAILLLLVISQLTTGQTIVRSSLSCLGSTITDNGLILLQTMGQPSSTDVLSMEGMELRQGFQQPVTAKNYIRNARQVDFTLSPNPAKDNTLISFKEEISGCSISVRDINGSILFKCMEETLYDKWLDITGIVPGIYIVTVVSGNGHSSKKLIITN